MERLWEAATNEAIAVSGDGSGVIKREFADTGGPLPSVLGYTRHDTLYAEARPNSNNSTDEMLTSLAGYGNQSNVHNIELSDEEDEDFVGSGGDLRG